MNTISVSSPSDVLEMRRFLARVVRTPIQAIKVTGNPVTDENTDLLLSHTDSATEKLCSLRACEIDSIFAGDVGRLANGEPDAARAAILFDAFLAERRPLYS